MNELLAAFKTKIGATTGLNGCPFYLRAPESTPKPYGRITFLTNNITGCYTTSNLEQIVVQFDIFSEDMDDACLKQQALETAFDRVTLTLSGATGFKGRLTTSLIEVKDRSTNNKDVWQMISRFEFSLQK